jgi:predicted transcriptional regulator
MQANEIRAELLRRNIKVSDIAAHLRIAQPSVSQVIHSKKKTKYIREYIAQKVGKPVSCLWPEQDEAL